MSRNLKLTRPLAVLDLETTGTVPSLDRIVEIAIVKIYPDGRKTRYHERVNPGVPIPPEATKVHGIGDKEVRNCPAFKNLAAKIGRFLEDCDLAGYNLVRFDLPLLRCEFARAGFEFWSDGRRIVDVCQIFHKKEPRDLPAALKFFCAQEHSQAHSALHDVRATWKVLEAQLTRYTDLPLDMQGLHDFCNEHDDRFVDAERKFEWRHNEATFAFGKYRGRSLREVAEEEPGFLEWMLTKDFEAETKAIVAEALKGHFPKQRVGGK
jgi:DNA polymerase-3 subunit epsilon